MVPRTYLLSDERLCKRTNPDFLTTSTMAEYKSIGYLEKISLIAAQRSTTEKVEAASCFGPAFGTVPCSRQSSGRRWQATVTTESPRLSPSLVNKHGFLLLGDNATPHRKIMTSFNKNLSLHTNFTINVDWLDSDWTCLGQVRTQNQGSLHNSSNKLEITVRKTDRPKSNLTKLIFEKQAPKKFGLLDMRLQFITLRVRKQTLYHCPSSHPSPPPSIAADEISSYHYDPDYKEPLTTQLPLGCSELPQLTSGCC